MQGSPAFVVAQAEMECVQFIKLHIRPSKAPKITPLVLFRNSVEEPAGAVTAS